MTKIKCSICGERIIKIEFDPDQEGLVLEHPPSSLVCGGLMGRRWVIKAREEVS
jgi:hypothetical protein